MPDEERGGNDPAAEAILELLRGRGAGKTICPSEAARALAGERDFHLYMESVRAAAARLADRGRVVVSQKGRPVRVSEARGPIRIGLPEAR